MNKQTQSEVILVVDDDPRMLRATERVLKRNGFRALPVSDPDEVLKILGDPTVKVDLLLTDVMMPMMSGRKLVEAAHRIRRDLPVLFMSGYTNDKVLLRCVAEGIYTLIDKPFEIAVLLGLIRALIDAKPRPNP